MNTRHFLFIVILIAISFISSAKCGGSGIGLHTKTVLAKDGIIIVEFYSSDQYIAEGLNKRHPVSLKSGQTTIKLTVLEVLSGDYQLTQVILRPDTILSEKEEYRLYIEDLNNKAFPPKFLNEKSRNWISGPITVKRNVTTDVSAFNYMITETKKTLVSYGCGPASWVYFNVSGLDSSTLYVRTTVKSLRSGSVTTYVLPIENGQVRVGHGMCSGAFYFKNAGDYEVTFTLTDQSYNKSITSRSLVFSQPVKATDEE